MLKSERQKEILKILEASGTAEIKEISRIFNVAEMTVRRDLDELIEDSRNHIVRTHGGAVVSEEHILLEPSFGIRNTQNKEAKAAIAKEALKLINDGQKILLDSGTTTFSLAMQIENFKRLIVLTNAVNIAIELNMRPNISVIPVGGSLRKNTFSCVGNFAEAMISQFKVDIAFIGVGGISSSGALSNGSMVENGVKKAMLEAAKRKIILADSSKIGKEEFSIFGHLKDIDLLITDSNAPKDIISKFKKLNIEIKIVNL
jgi:DeoR family fructose operon transcriptional repressor